MIQFFREKKAGSALLKVKTGVATAGAECLARVRYRCRQLRAAAGVAAVMPHSGFDEFGHWKLPFVPSENEKPRRLAGAVGVKEEFWRRGPLETLAFELPLCRGVISSHGLKFTAAGSPSKEKPRRPPPQGRQKAELLTVCLTEGRSLCRGWPSSFGLPMKKAQIRSWQVRPGEVELRVLINTASVGQHRCDRGRRVRLAARRDVAVAGQLGGDIAERIRGDRRRCG